ncbi:winged helix-turn-helix domain-containing protein [Enterobacteriaceae bacterium H4N4]|uniref:Winged helix-turn-helix domain-containing protein n=1 Tax=Silvania confinis TaxID=2926470 RepID=A0A9J6QE89_9ENTR|nr:winged helix-turn-helix domain-containing protein [Silvania confinis]MCU6669249.1 winged helix-turn-helix domain-containing protein [Silvania confinis]
MKTVFLINETVLFEPDARRVCSRAHYPERAVILHGPVSECLLQLLEHNDQLLTQRYLFATVWEKQGAVVTTNALYQTIASIRKALKSAGLEDNVIITVPKAGFKSVAQLRTGSADAFVERHKTVQPLTLPDESIVERKPVATPLVSGFWTSRRAYGLAAGLFLLSCSVLFITLRQGESVFAHYPLIGNSNGCEVYSSWHDKEKSRSILEALSQRFPLPCKRGDVAYLTLNQTQQGISVIICDQIPENSAARCQSIFYRQPYDENE